MLFGSGLVGGEGLLGVAVAGVVFYQKWKAEDPTVEQSLPMEIGQGWAQRLADTFNVPALVDIAPGVLGLLAFTALAVFFSWRCRAG